MDSFDLQGMLQPFANIAGSGTAADWIHFGIYFIVSVLASGIVLVVLVKIAGMVFREDYNAGRAFIVALVITLINYFGIGFIAMYVSFLPMYVLNLLIWIGLIKVFFSDMGILKAVIIGALGFVLTLVVAPYLSGLIMGFMPI